MKRISVPIISFLSAILFVTFSHALTKIEPITSLCMQAYDAYSLDEKKLRRFEAEETITFAGRAGYAGGPFDAKKSIYGTLTMNNDGVRGYYYYDDFNDKQINIEGIMDINGNLMLNEIAEEGAINYIFKGKYINNEILGVWSKGGGKKQFVFFGKVHR